LEDASKPTRNGTFILNMELLIAGIFRCHNAAELIYRIAHDDVTPREDRIELIQMTMKNTKGNCFFEYVEDAKVD